MEEEDTDIMDANTGKIYGDNNLNELTEDNVKDEDLVFGSRKTLEKLSKLIKEEETNAEEV